MPRVLALIVLAALPLPLQAGEPTIRLTVQPMTVPKPALKYLLLPGVEEMNPGNAAQWYLRSFAEQRNFFYGKDSTAERTRFLSLPLAELPAEKMRGYGGTALRSADWAARLDTIDWQVIQRVQSEGLELAQPELGPLRILGTALQVRFRLDLAGGHFDDVIRDAKTMFGFARHLGENPTEAANRLGLTIAEATLDSLEEMIQQPGSPNLYWALTDLPSPLVDCRKGLQGTRILVTTDLKSLVDDTAMTAEQVEKVVGRISGVLGFAREQAGQTPRSFRGELVTRAKDSEIVHAARGRLIEAAPEALIPKFSPTQIILLDAKRDYELRRDESLKLLGLMPWQINTLSDNERGSPGDGLFADLVPQALKLRLAQVRIEQRIALLRHVEALRTYAAGQGGKLPQKLTDVAVPLPVDPFTGKSFRYELEKGIAHIRNDSPQGEEKNLGHNVHLVVTIKR